VPVAFAGEDHHHRLFLFRGGVPSNSSSSEDLLAALGSCRSPSTDASDSWPSSSSPCLLEIAAISFLRVGCHTFRRRGIALG
jgi:hypothetical protein